MNQFNRLLSVIVLMSLIAACANREPTGKEGEEMDTVKKVHGGQYNPDVRDDKSGQESQTPPGYNTGKSDSAARNVPK